MQHPKYKYDKNRKLLALVIFENSFSKYTVLCIQNTANVVAIHDKAQKDAKIEEKREAAAKQKANKVRVLVPKQLSVNSVPSFDCANPNCAIMFLKSKWLEKHTAAAKRNKNVK